MAAQAGLCLAWSETPEDAFCRDVAQFQDVFLFFKVLTFCESMAVMYMHVPPIHACVVNSYGTYCRSKDNYHAMHYMFASVISRLG